LAKKNWRINVAALILRQDQQGRIQLLMGARRDVPTSWQWPQGGVEEGETLEAAVLREIAEETDLAHCTILHRFDRVVRYRFPQKIKKRFHRYEGQEQTYFLVKTGDPQALRDHWPSSSAEFVHLAWHTPKKAVRTAPDFKRKAYRKACRRLLRFLKEHPELGLS
jgi:putative (di)nucleoside polyphosphate hydrolase